MKEGNQESVSLGQAPQHSPTLGKDEAEQESKLTPEDLGRVERYLASPVHQVERKPFRPWVMMGALVAIVVLLGGFSRLISWFVLG